MDGRKRLGLDSVALKDPSAALLGGAAAVGLTEVMACGADGWAPRNAFAFVIAFDRVTVRCCELPVMGLEIFEN